MKIALISPYDFPYPGGVTEHIVGLANGVRKRGHKVHILAACSGYHGVTYPDTQVVTRRVAPIPIGGTIARVGLSAWTYPRLKQILQREAFDVIHLHEPLTPSLTWLVLLQRCTLPQSVTVGTFHAYHEHPNWFYARGRPIFKKFFTRLDALIAVSRAARDFAHQMFPGDYQIIPNGVDLARFGQKSRPTIDDDLTGTSQTVTILFVGRLDKRKGFGNLLTAFINLKPNYPQLRLKVAGPFEAYEADRYRRLIPVSYATDIEFVGYVSPERLAGLYHSADIFCAPSIGFESFGIVLLEAMAAGIPIVASDIAGYRAVIAAGQEGLLVPPDQPQLLADALRLLVENPRLRQELGGRGQKKATQYSWDQLVDKILQLYQSTIERKLSVETKFVPNIDARIHLQPRQANPESNSC